LTKLFLNELMGSLQTQEQRLNKTANSSLEHVFRSQVSVCNNEGMRGRGVSSSSASGRGRTNNFLKKENSTPISLQVEEATTSTITIIMEIK
ncbi:hypothetical protein KI387_018979, partial [Taxus chinensis]